MNRATLHLCGDTWVIEHEDTETCTHHNCHTVQLAERVPA